MGPFKITLAGIIAIGITTILVLDRQERRELRQEMAALRKGTDGPPGRFAAPQLPRVFETSGANAIPPNEKGPEGVVPQSGNRNSAPEPPTLDDVRVFVQSTFEGQTVDRTWAVETRTSLDGVFRAHLPERSLVKSMECRSSLCRVVLVHPAEQLERDFMASTVGLWPGGYMVTDRRTAPTGEVEVTIMAAGKGANVPVLD